MILPFAEVAPAVPAAGALAAFLESVILFIVAVGLSILWFQILRKLAVAVSNVSILRVHPFHFLKPVIETLDKWISGAEKGTERAVTWSLHALMWSISTGYKDTRDLAQAVWHRFTTIPHAKTTHEKATQPVNFAPRIKTLEREYKGIDQRLDNVEKRERAKKSAGAAAGAQDVTQLRHGIDRLNKRVGTLEHEFAGIDATNTHVGTKVGAKEGTQAKTKVRVVTRTRAHANKWTDIFSHAGIVSVGVAALAALGLSWLRCPSLGRIGKKLGCGGFSRLEPFLATTFEALVVLDLCRFALATQALARAIVPQLGAVLLVQNAVCLGGGASVASAMDTPKISTSIQKPSGLLKTEA